MKAVEVISVPELDPPDITVVNVSVTLVTACRNIFIYIFFKVEVVPDHVTHLAGHSQLLHLYQDCLNRNLFGCHKTAG